MAKVIALFSGGMDSTVLVAHLLAEGHQVIPLGVNYGQRHVKELQAGEAVADYYGLDFDVVDLTSLRVFLRGSVLTGKGPIPEGHYAEESMRATVVPNRNAIMLSVGAGVAVSRGAAEVVTAVHAGDHFIYPDCRPEFIEAMRLATMMATEGFGDIRISAPFVMKTKAEIAKLGDELRVPFGLTWSCYKGEDYHCGACGTCFERREAFTLAGVIDPTIYDSMPDYAAP